VPHVGIEHLCLPRRGQERVYPTQDCDAGPSFQSSHTQFVYELRTGANGKFTGTQRGPFGDSPIVDGKVTGDKVELTVETESFGSLSKNTITGTIVGEELHITPAMPGGGRGRGPGGPLQTG